MNWIFAFFRSDVERPNEIIIIIGYESLASTESHHVRATAAHQRNKNSFIFLSFSSYFTPLHIHILKKMLRNETRKQENMQILTEFLPTNNNYYNAHGSQKCLICSAFEKFNLNQRLYQGGWSTNYEYRNGDWIIWEIKWLDLRFHLICLHKQIYAYKI